MEPEFVPSAHRKPCMVYNQYIFQKAKTNKDGSINWRCKNYYKTGVEKCNVTCTSLADEFVNGRSPPMYHEHEPPSEGQKHALVFNDLLKTEVQRTTKPLKQLYEKAWSKFAENEEVDFEEFAKSSSQFDNIRRGLGKIRRKNTPKLPSSLVEIDLDGQYINTIDRKRFLLFDTRGTERIIAYSSQRQMMMLAQSTRWHVDGTFKASPSIFGQLYLIHAWYKDEMNPCVFLLLPNRRKNTYLRMLRQLKFQANQMELQLDPKQIMPDFEIAVIESIKEEFPNAEIKGCHFHHTQCIWRKIQDLGLATVYKENRCVRHWLECFKSLSFIPLTLVEITFNLLVSKKPQSEHGDKFDLFVKYFRSTWFTLFPPRLWNHHETIGPRTNNHVEGYNNKINLYIDCDHPNVFSLVNTLKQLESIISKNFIQRNNGAPSKTYRRPKDIKKDEAILYLKTLLHYNSISLENYLIYIAKLFSYDKSVRLNNQTIDFFSFVNFNHPIDLRVLQDKPYEYIKNYMQLNKHQFIDLVKFFRNQKLVFYYNQSIDYNFSALVELYSKAYKSIS